MSHRKTEYDFLRFIGISCIVLAHVDAPGYLFQIRNFDVPLMVFLSGISFSEFSWKRYSKYGKYIKARFLRLVLPTWIFLVFFNLAFYISSKDIPSAKEIISQAFLVGGTPIGVWIIRIFFSVAIMAPSLQLINRKIKKPTTFYLFLIISYFLYEFSLYHSKALLPKASFEILYLSILSAAPYMLIFIYGLRVNSFKKEAIQIHILTSGILFALTAGFLFWKNQSFTPTQEFKYPPKSYYLSYAMFASITIYYFLKFSKTFIHKIKIIQFVGGSTLWIYLWHWFFIAVYNHLKIDLPFFHRYLLIYSATVFWVYLQTKFTLYCNDWVPFRKEKESISLRLFTG
jgi:fucose 4-O-acetylase-like acetyltransferase